jgi:Protein of unknown function (DUF3313)
MRPIRSLSIAFVALALGACAVPGSEHRSGFLGDYSGLKKSSQDAELASWFDPKVDFLEYDRLMIDPIEVVLAPGAEAASADPAVLKALAAELHDTVFRVVDPYYTILDAPASRTIRVRVALTDVKLRDGGTTSADVLGARIEWEMLDAQTTKRIGAGMRWRDVPAGETGFEPWAKALLKFMNSRQEMTR